MGESMPPVSKTVAATLSSSVDSPGVQSERPRETSGAAPPPALPSALHGLVARKAGSPDTPPAFAAAAAASSSDPPARGGTVSPAHHGAGNGELDLRAASPFSCLVLPSDLTDASRDGITTLRLPAGVGALPDWVESLANLTCLDIRGYRGSVLRADNPRLKKIIVDGPFIKRIETTAAEAVGYCRRNPNGAYDKVEMHYLDPCNGELVRKEAAIGHRYYTPGADGRVIYRYMNGLARFPDGGGPIVCMHLAIHQIHCAMAHGGRLGSERLAEVWARTMATVDDIASAVDPATAFRFQELVTRPGERHHVGNALWGRFMRDQFATLDSGRRKYFLLCTTEHGMSLELAVAATPHGERYIATLFDPNSTHTRARIVEDDLNEIARWQAETFFSPQQLQQKFPDAMGAFLPPDRQVSCFIAIPEDFGTRAISEPIVEENAGPGVLREYLSDTNRSSVATLYYRFLSGEVNTTMLRESIDRCSTANEKFLLLKAPSLSGPGLFLAMAFGHVRSIEALGEVLVEQRRAGWITDEQFKEILWATRADGKTGLDTAAADRRIEAIRAWANIVLMACQSGWISPAQAKAALTVSDENDSALRSALPHGFLEVIEAAAQRQ